MLSKSEIHSFRQCPRKLWLEKNAPDISPEVDLGAERRKNEGIAVGGMARKALGPNVIWPVSEAYVEDSVQLAKAQLQANPTCPAVEVPFMHDDVYVRVDALIPMPNGVVLRETKASAFPLKTDKVTPGKPDKDYVADLAIQVYVMEQSGTPVMQAELNLLDTQWKYPGNGDYSKMFRRLNVTEEVRDVIIEVPLWIQEAKTMLTGRMPKAVSGSQCSKPHGCGYLGHCKKLDPPKPAHPIELLPDVGGKNLARKLKAEHGYVSLLDPKPNELVGSNAKLYKRMQLAHFSGKPYLSPDSGTALEDLPYPRYYFDFEGIDLAIPVWQGVRPYEQIPFQWSCHIERAPGVFELGGFLDMSGNDPSLGCIEQLLKTIDLEDNGPIFVYFAAYERGRLEELAKRHPQYARQLENYVSRIVDLLPIVKDHYYHPKMEGSFSIKKVLPVIAPDLNYDKLTEVSDGTGAQLAYIRAALDPSVSAQAKAETEVNAKAYCCQDTWAMVEVAYFIQHKPRPVRPEGM